MKLSVKDLDLSGKRVFVRVDFNVPIKNGVIGDDTRIRASLPTIRYALEKGATVILASHLGRPKGKPVPEYSLAPVVPRLSELLGRKVVFASDCIGEPARAAVAEAHAHDKVVLLENLRFHPEEEKNDPAFAGQLAALADLYVDDAFGSAHRAHASVEGIIKQIGRGAAGLLMEKELQYLGHALETPERPFVAVLGGAKVSDKIEVIENMLGKVDALLIGGAMAYTFLKARGVPTGKSLVEEDSLDSARAITDKARELGVRLELPSRSRGRARARRQRTAGDAGDRRCRRSASGWASTSARKRRRCTPASSPPRRPSSGTARWVCSRSTPSRRAPPPWPKPSRRYRARRSSAAGDSIAAIHKAGVADRVSHISTGGGASLEFLGGRVLPGVAALTDK